MVLIDAAPLTPIADQFLRTVPRQARSAARLEAILDAAGRVLQRGGLEELSMAAVAADAGIPPASVYDYFADATSLLGCFVCRNLDRNHELLCELLRSLDRPSEVVGCLHLILDEIVHNYQDTLGFEEAMSASGADRTLARINLEDSRRNAAVLERAMRPFVAEHNWQLLADRTLLAAHLGGTVARLSLMLEPGEAERIKTAFIDLFIDILRVD